MGETRNDWLRCKNCNRKGKYTFNTDKVSYDYLNKKIILDWNLICKFCNKELTVENLADTSLTTLYILLLIRNLDGSI
ncbi:MAG: hypothetical protein ABIJ20_01545 [Nanoarchaeota archaeon]|nr:hypothetical protein [Nanoarchaeota archaeon]